jgi:ferredoxin
MNIPRMLRQIAAGDPGGAIVTVKQDIALPAVLGRICSAPCEKACRRRPADGPVAICLLKRFAADVDLAAPTRYLPTRQPATGKRVAIVGAGPTGLAAAYYLLAQGHAVTVFDEREQPGGRLRDPALADELPPEVLDADIEPVLRLGAELRISTRLGGAQSLDELAKEHAAVLLACGAAGREQAEVWGLRPSSRGIQVQKDTYETGREGVFAAGAAVRGKLPVVRSVADGKEAAVSIGQYLAGRPVTGAARPFTTKIGRLEPEELAQYVAGAAQDPRRDPAGAPKTGFSAEESAGQAARCMHCDCRGLDSCKLRKYAALYQADPRRYRGQRRTFEQDVQHAEVIYEPGKCIDCGLCVEIARAAGEELGLTFVGRGFDVRVGVPLGRSLDVALRKVAAECAAACPTAALALREKARASGLPILG